MQRENRRNWDRAQERDQDKVKPEFTEISKEKQRYRERDAKKAKRNGRTSEKDRKRENVRREIDIKIGRVRETVWVGERNGRTESEQRSERKRAERGREKARET